MAESLGDVIIKLRSQDVNMASGLRSVGEELNKLGNKVFSFEGLLHIGFGGQAGRAMFHEMRHLIEDFGEGMLDASAKGATFGESLDSGVAHVFKLKSAFEETTEAAKKLSEVEQGIFKADDKTAEFLKSAGEKGSITFGDRSIDLDEEMPLLSKEQQSKFKDAMAAYKEQRKKIREGDAELSKKSPMQNVSGLADQSAYLSHLKEIQGRYKEDQGTVGDSAFLATGGINGSSGLDAEIGRVQKRVDNLKAATAQIGDREKELRQHAAGAEATNTKNEIVDMWGNIKKSAAETMDSIQEHWWKLREGFTKEGDHASKEAHDKHQREAEERYRRNFEYHKKLGEEAKQKDKQDTEEAKRFKEDGDPKEKLKDDFKEIERLFTAGKLTRDQANLEERKKATEFARNEAKLDKPELRSADAYANDMLAKSLGDAAVQKEILGVLKEMRDTQANKKPCHGMVA